MTSDSKKLVLGLISGLSLEQVKPFFLSLEKCQYRGDTCMVVGNLGLATLAFLRARHVQLIPFPKAFLKGLSEYAAKLPGTLLSPRRRSLYNHLLAPAYMHPRCARYFLYQSYLQECGGAYSHVLLADIRDVFFQADPFASDPPDGLSVFLEDGDRCLETPAPVATGVILGSGPSIQEHLAQLTDTLIKRRDRRPIDKEAHSFLVRHQPSTKLHCFENFEGPVLNLANTDPSALRFAADGRLQGRGGEIASVLHQYDRHADLQPKLMALLT